MCRLADDTYDFGDYSDENAINEHRIYLSSSGYLDIAAISAKYIYRL